MKHIPSLLATSAALLLAVPATLHAERTDQGTVGLGGNLYYDPDTAFGGRLDVGILGGYYIADGWLLGGEFSLTDDDFTSLYGVSLMLERDFELGEADTITPFIPYVAGSVGYVSADYKGSDDESSDDETGLTFGLRLGLKLMLTGSTALDFSLRGEFATADVFYDDDGPDSTDISVRIGLRTFFF